MNNPRPRTLRRELGRWLLLRRARRLSREREMLELEEFLDDIRESGWVRKIYGDEVES